MTATTILLVALAVYRGTLLVTGDRITRTPRRRLRKWLTAQVRPVRCGACSSLYCLHKVAVRDRQRAPLAADLLECPWCVSAHLGILAAMIAWAWPEGWWRWPALALAASGVTGFMATLAAPDGNDEDD